MTTETPLTRADVHPFQIDVDQSEIDRLHRRLDETRWPEILPGDGWDNGVPVCWLRELADYWRNAYDWRAAEREINRPPQFTTVIAGQQIHFLHVRSAEHDALPLILTHGWPGSVVEFLDVIGPLTDPVAHGGDRADAFHVVVPALPGFGFSGPVAESGWTTTKIAEVWDELMARLGYPRYGTQGGDIGAAVAPEIARVPPERVVGVHANGGPGGFPQLPLPDEIMATLSPTERDRIARVESSCVRNTAISPSSRRVHRRWDTDSPIHRWGNWLGSWTSFANGLTRVMCCLIRSSIATDC